MCDEGDADRYNASLLLDGRPLLQFSRQGGLHVGGTPRYRNGGVVRVEEGFSEGEPRLLLTSDFEAIRFQEELRRWGRKPCSLGRAFNLARTLSRSRLGLGWVGTPLWPFSS